MRRLGNFRGLYVPASFVVPTQSLAGMRRRLGQEEQPPPPPAPTNSISEWLDQELISGVKNKYLALGVVAALFFFCKGK